MTLQFIENYVKFKKENVMNIDENKDKYSRRNFQCFHYIFIVDWLI